MTTTVQALTAPEAEAPRVVGKRRSARVIFQSMLLRLFSFLSHPLRWSPPISVNSVASVVHDDQTSF